MFRVLIITLLSGFISCGSDTAKKVDSQSKSITGIQEIDDVTRLIFKDGDNPELYKERAALYMKKGIYENALYDLKKAISMDSLNPAYYHLLSDAYMDNMDSKMALETMKRITKIHPERIPSLLKLSETEFILKQYENAMFSATKVLSLNPNEAEGYFMLGMILRETNDDVKALNSFQTAIEMNPELVDAWLILGEMYEEKKDPIAIKYYEGATQADPNNISAMHYKALYMQNHGREADAVEVYKNIILKDKFYSDAYLNAGLLYLEMDSIELAKEHFNIMTRTAPQKYLGHYYLGICNEMLGDFDEARENMRSAQNLNQEDKRIGKAAARISEKQGS